LNIILTIRNSTEETAVVDNTAAAKHQAKVIPSTPELKQHAILHTKKLASELGPVRRSLVAKHARSLAKREMKPKTLNPAREFTIIDIRTEELLVKNINRMNLLYCLVSYEVHAAVCQTYFFFNLDALALIHSSFSKIHFEFLGLRGEERKKEQACK